MASVTKTATAARTFAYQPTWDAGKTLYAWANPTYAGDGQNGLYTSAVLMPTGFGGGAFNSSQVLHAYTFAFVEGSGAGQIPAGSTITGVKVEWYKYGTAAVVGNGHLSLAGTDGNPTGTDYPDTGGTWPQPGSGNATWVAYGGDGSMWGMSAATLYAMIFDADFGACLVATNFSAVGSPTPQTAYVDSCRITIYYTAPATGAPWAYYRRLRKGP